jgi:glycosyltransferase involved in cell wall biosynthesis
MFKIGGESIPAAALLRPRAKGRFLFLGDSKFNIKGVTYGPFAPNHNGDPLPEPQTVAEDFRQMREAGVNTLRLYYVPPRWFLDLAAANGLYLIVGIPWPQHICFLDQWEVKEDIKRKVFTAAAACKNHPAVLAYLIGNEIPSHIVRWHGAKRIESFLKTLTDIVRAEDPGAMVSYANYPSTEYLRLPFLDFISFNVYLQSESAFRGYLKRLQNVAGDLPLVLSEFGLDSMRNGQENQAEILAWMLPAAFELGVSGTVVFAWTDEWFTGGHLIEDWAFGMVDAARAPKPALDSLAAAYARPQPKLPGNTPFISVVVCAYNAASTMDGCLASFLKVDYPAFEVVVVDDGSKDETGAIADRYAALAPDRYVVVHQANQGLSVARNVGFAHSRGEIIAYTDSDCYVDPHWLTYMALAFADPRFAAVGGPNLPPPEDNRVAACVAVSPGAPTHVLLKDDLAEHIPGCNMAFRREALAAVDGFDATYRAAGDDVDVCWRLQDLGYTIGFSAAMTVWHHRRNTIKAYLKQQMGYGRAEALLAPKHHERFNALGNSRWAGRIYGDISGHILSVRPRIYHGVFGNGLFQCLYEPAAGLASHLPLSFEWIMAGLALCLLGFGLPAFALAGGLMLATSAAWAGYRAAFARLPEAYDDWRSRALIALLTLSQPVLRGYTRYRTLLSLAVSLGRVRKKDALTDPDLPGGLEAARWGLTRMIRNGVSLVAHRFSFSRFFWNHHGLERGESLRILVETLKSLNLDPRLDSGYASTTKVPPWDVQIRPGFLTLMQLRVTVENHGGLKRFVRLAGSVLPSGTANALALGFLATGLSALALGARWEGLALLAGLLALLGWVTWEMFSAAGLFTSISQRLVVHHADLEERSEEISPPACVRVEVN